MKGHFHIEPALLHQIVQLLSDAAGIDPVSLETRRMTWTIERRCRHLHLESPSAYLKYLQSSTAELEDLIDALVIHETRFFRDPAVFDHLRKWAQGMAASCSGPLCVLSAPCSTGQEAYSLAAILCCGGISSFTIDAFDISHTALTAAERGVYPARALEAVPSDLRDASGTFENQHWHMRDELRSRIRFERRNLADASALNSEPGYHLILSRNLFIYLHAGARAILAQSLSKALLPDGCLIVGAGDRVAELNARFTAVHLAAGFGFTHKSAAATLATPSVASSAPLVHRAKGRILGFALPMPKSEDHAPPATAVEYYRRSVEYKERGNDRQALYLAPAYLAALELLQSLWHVHPDARLRRALKARIVRVRAENEVFVATLRPAEGGTA